MNLTYFQKDIFSQLGINYLNMALLLGYSKTENLPCCRDYIINELGQCIASTGPLFKIVAGGNAPQ